MMGHVTPAVPLLVVLFSVWVVPVLSSCHSNGPSNCNFDNSNTCGWARGSGWRINWQWRWGWPWYNYVLEFDDEQSGRVESRIACSTGGSTHCLKFDYRFESDNVVDLNVIIRPVSSQIGETLVWTKASSSRQEHNARVPINTGHNFTVIIEAKTRNGQKSDNYVRIDDIVYRQSSCAIQPSNAEPTTTTTTTAATSTTTTTATTMTTATSTQSISVTSPAMTTESTTVKSSYHDGTSGQTSATREAHMESTSPATTPVTADQAASAQSQDDVATIVGAVVCVVVVAVVVVVLLLVFRRKQLSFFKTRFKADKQKGEHFDVTASHNAAYNLDLGDQGETSDMKMTAINTEHHSPPLEATAPPHSSDDYYNIVSTPHKDVTPEPPNQMYAAVSKPRRPNLATANTTHQLATPLLSDPMHAAVTKAHRPNPGPQPTVTDPAQDSPYEIASDTPDCTAHQPAGDAAAGVYHCLEDDPETPPQLDTTDPYLAPDTLDTDTYTLDTDTYTLDTDTYTLDTDTYALDTDTYTLDTDTYTLDTDTCTLAQHLYDVPPGARPTPPSATHPVQKNHQLSVTPHGQDGDYNSLDLGGRRPVEERGEGPGNVYSGLNEGDSDTYSEVNHHRRKEVIDDQYSRFQ